MHGERLEAKLPLDDNEINCEKGKVLHRFSTFFEISNKAARVILLERYVEFFLEIDAS